MLVIIGQKKPGQKWHVFLQGYTEPVSQCCNLVAIPNGWEAVDHSELNPGFLHVNQSKYCKNCVLTIQEKYGFPVKSVEEQFIDQVRELISGRISVKVY